MAFLVPIETAALKALAAWLRSKLPTPLPSLTASPAGVVVSTKWPDADKQIPARAVSLIFAGSRRDTLTEPTVESYEVIHDGISQKIATATATDLATAITLLNACRSSYEAHRISTSAHIAADIANPISAPAATDQATAYALATEMYADITAHVGMATVHPTVDSENTLTGTVTNTVLGLVAAAESIRRALNQHYVARVYVWRIRECEQPVQLDVWAVYDASREDIIARLEPLLNASRVESAGFSFDIDDPVRNGVIVALGDGWPGYAYFRFEQPLRTTTSTSQKQSEFRATYAGTATFWLLVKAQSPRIARATLAQTIDSAASHTATISSSTSGEPTETFTSI